MATLGGGQEVKRSRGPESGHLWHACNPVSVIRENWVLRTAHAQCVLKLHIKTIFIWHSVAGHQRGVSLSKLVPKIKQNYRNTNWDINMSETQNTRAVYVHLVYTITWHDNIITHKCQYKTNMIVILISSVQFRIHISFKRDLKELWDWICLFILYRLSNSADHQHKHHLLQL